MPGRAAVLLSLLLPPRGRGGSEAGASGDFKGARGAGRRDGTVDIAFPCQGFLDPLSATRGPQGRDSGQMEGRYVGPIPGEEICEERMVATQIWGALTKTGVTVDGKFYSEVHWSTHSARLP